MSITSYTKTKIDQLLSVLAPLNSPAFTGTPTVNGTPIGSGGSGGVSSFQTRTGAVSLTKTDVTGTGLAASDVGADASGAAAAVAAQLSNYVTGLPDVTVTGASPTLAISKRTTVDAGAAAVAPAVPSSVATIPARFAVAWPTAGGGTITYPNAVGTSVTTTTLAGETLIFRNVGSGWAAESGNKTLASLASMFVAELTDTTVAGAAPPLAVGARSFLSASGAAATAPTLPASVGTPPTRWSAVNASTGSQTVTYPNNAGTSTTLILQPGDAAVFRQTSTSGWTIESNTRAAVGALAGVMKLSATATISTFQTGLNASATAVGTTLTVAGDGNPIELEYGGLCELDINGQTAGSSGRLVVALVDVSAPTVALDSWQWTGVLATMPLQQPMLKKFVDTSLAAGSTRTYGLRAYMQNASSSSSNTTVNGSAKLYATGGLDWSLTARRA